MTFGLVLGGGGVLGGAWEVGALQALQRVAGWDPREAEAIIGTSVGALIGAVLAAGVFPEIDLLDAALHRREGTRSPLPGSWRLGMNGIRRHGGRRWIMTVGGLLPRGSLSTAPIKESIERRIPHGWPSERLSVIACDYETGERVVFSRSTTPPVDLATAVAASCAVPGVYAPVKIDDRLYVDGGLCSPVSLDLTIGGGLDTVICLNPMSSTAIPSRSATLASRLMAAAEHVSHRSLMAEVEAVRHAGTPVILVEPGPEDQAAMGLNLMNSKRTQFVLDTAFRSVTEELALRGSPLAAASP